VTPVSVKLRCTWHAPVLHIGVKLGGGEMSLPISVIGPEPVVQEAGSLNVNALRSLTRSGRKTGAAPASPVSGSDGGPYSGSSGLPESAWPLRVP
jgi:hypothetical protein